MPEQAAAHAEIFELHRLLTHWNVLLIFAVWAAIQTLRRVTPDPWFEKRAPLGRLLPVLPLLICGVAVWIPGPWLSGDESVGQKIVLGVVLGALAANFHSIAMRFGLAKLLRLEDTSSSEPEGSSEDEQTEKVKKAPQ